MSDFSFFFLNY
uniref:Uncharacterized protein n=1 Tax=Anguilla anguilla TaxID=7936 RepID=A0A0E9TSW3_ANGAN